MPGTVLETGITSPQRGCTGSNELTSPHRGCTGSNELKRVTRRAGYLISMAISFLFLIRQWSSNCHRLSVAGEMSNKGPLPQGPLALSSLLSNSSIAHLRIQGKEI